MAIDEKILLRELDLSESAEDAKRAAGDAGLPADDVAERKFPAWLDIWLYPANLSGLSTIAIIVLVPAFFQFVKYLVSLTGFFPLTAALTFLFWICNLFIFFYIFWYFSICVSDSFSGRVRAPEVMASNMDESPMELFLHMVRFLVCSLIFFGPSTIYSAVTQRTDGIYFLLLGAGVFLWPMSIISVVYCDGLGGLNPLAILPAAIKTIVPYTGVVLLCLLVYGLGVGLVFAFSFLAQYPGVFLILEAGGLYLFFVTAHVMGRFYYNHEERIGW